MRYDNVTDDYIKKEKRRYTDFPVPKWLLFCETMLKKGYALKVCKAITTRSKYVLLAKNNQSWKVRFSNHKPNYNKQMFKDCDYYVGIHHTGVINTDQVIKEILKNTVKEKLK